MARFDSRDRPDRSSRPSSSRGGSSFGGSRGGSSFGGRRPSFGSRGSSSYGGNRREIQKTKVTCSECGQECEVPFKPTSNKPVYCSACFSKQGGGSFGGSSKKDFEVINAKLDKIMKALKIE
ncbi:MAG: CxxC-x17-CxxC domain-containing protein [archaeon]